jgi:hypothetical protein
VSLVDKQRRVVLYGQSVVLGALRASLERHLHLEVVSVSPLATADALVELAPEAILYDAGDGCPGSAVALLRTHPDLLLIVVDPASEELLLVTGQRYRPQSADELAQVITGRLQRT